MDLPFPEQFDLAAEPLTTIDYRTLLAMLVARGVAESQAFQGPARNRNLGGTLADRLHFFAGRLGKRKSPAGAFAPLAAAVPNSKYHIYLGASGYGRNMARMMLPTPREAVPAHPGEKQ